MVITVPDLHFLTFTWFLYNAQGKGGVGLWAFWTEWVYKKNKNQSINQNSNKEHGCCSEMWGAQFNSTMSLFPSHCSAADFDNMHYWYQGQPWPQIPRKCRSPELAGTHTVAFSVLPTIVKTASKPLTLLHFCLPLNPPPQMNLAARSATCSQALGLTRLL